LALCPFEITGEIGNTGVSELGIIAEDIILEIEFYLREE